MIYPRKSLYFLLAFWFLFAGLGLYKLTIRPALPYSIKEVKEGILLTDPPGTTESKQLASPVVLTIDNMPVSKIFEVDTVVENKRIGDSVIITLSNNTSLHPILVSRSDNWIVLINGFSGLCCLIISLILMIYGKQKEERYFSLFAYLLGLSLVMTWPGMKLPFVLTLTMSLVYFASFSLGVVTLFFFSLHFPALTISEKPLKIIKYIISTFGLAFCFALSVLNLLKIHRPTAQSMRVFESFYEYFGGFAFLLTLLTVVSIFINSRREANPINRRKMQWMIWGVLIGGTPYFILWRLPQIFDLSPLIPESATNLFFILGAACVAIAILKYRLFDIEIVLSRSLVYSAVIIMLACIYLLSVGGLSLLVFKQISLQSPVLSVLSAMLIAILFNPLKNKVQGFVDRKFFRIRYDRFQSHRACKHALEACQDQIQILSVLGIHFQKSIPTKNQMFLIRTGTKWDSLDPGRKPNPVLQKWLDSKEHDFFIEPLVNIRKQDKIEVDLPTVTAELPSPWVIMIPIGGEALWFLEQKKSGTRFWKEDLELAIHMASSANLELEKFRLILQKQREIERIQTAKMESLRRLVAGTAHDLNNPIGVISSSTDVSLKAIDKMAKVLDQELPKEKILKMTDFLRIFELMEDANRSCKIAADKVAKTVINLRRFVRLDEGEWQIVDIHDGLDSVLALLEPDLENRIVVQKDYGTLPQIYCSPSGLNQVFMYILKNAVEAIEERGEIQVKTTATDDTLRIHIRDTGIGIPHANLKRIFDPGYTTKGVKVGVGLGLSISYQILKEHNGSIDVSSQLGKGSTFIISLPYPK